ncbi:hypothetical protein DDI_4379 [Dickeya dianthicola RNS04.9]|nr:hypothetical protein DDI_4379 [Dickeya dianthicola RNS04.9]
MHCYLLANHRNGCFQPCLNIRFAGRFPQLRYFTLKLR